MRIGIQLYTLRDELRQDFKGVCRELAKLGCDGVEFASFFGNLEPDELAAFLKELKLDCCGMQVGGDQLKNVDSKVFQYAEALKSNYVSISYAGDFTKVWQDCAALCAISGHNAARHGLQFTYHNHAAEMVDVDGIAALDRILMSNDPREVMAEPDVYWLAKGGADPVAYIKKYRTRIPQLHMKDMDQSDGGFTELGAGCIDLAACVAAARESICEWLIYEQDTCRKSPLESAAISIRHLKKLLQKEN